MAQPLLVQDPICPRSAPASPRVLVRASGARVFDADGGDWIDFDNARSSVLLGHGDPAVAEAVARAARGECGATTGWTPLVDSVLEKLHALCGAPVMGLFRSGTAAVRAAVSAARQVSGRQVLLSAGYHGYDPMWTPAEKPLSANADGVLDFCYDLEVLGDCLDQYDGEVAAVVVSVDPVYHQQDWYARLRDTVAPHGVPVVLDEVKSGLRFRPGLFVDPAVLSPHAWIVSKGVANGHPVAAVGGDPELLAPMRRMTYTSFFEPTVLAAADATLARVATGEVQDLVRDGGGRFVAHARETLRAGDIPVDVAGSGLMFQFVCADTEVELAFYAAAARERLLFYESDHQAPSAALAGDVLDEACARFSRVGAALAGRWSGHRITEWSRYLAAWWEMCGLPDEDRTPDETRAWIARLTAEG